MASTDTKVKDISILHLIIIVAVVFLFIKLLF